MKNAKFVAIKESNKLTIMFFIQGRTNRWKEALKHLEDVPLLSEQNDFFLKVWPHEKEEIKELQADSTTTDRITTAEPRVK